MGEASDYADAWRDGDQDRTDVCREELEEKATALGFQDSARAALRAGAVTATRKHCDALQLLVESVVPAADAPPFLAAIDAIRATVDAAP
jgi:hypothetical protein